MNLFETLQRECQGRVLRDELLRHHTSFQIGGPADYFVWAERSGDISAAQDMARAEGCAFLVIGNGTNLLVNDQGVRGVVVRLGHGFQKLERDEEVVRVGAAVNLPELLNQCAGFGLSGLEFAAGIPGTVGGSVYVNAKTRSGWIRNPLSEIQVVTREKGVAVFDGEIYRNRFELDHRGHIIIGAMFLLQPAAPEAIRHEIDRYLVRRQETQPMELPSAGCIFQNPESQPAGRLIDQSGCKGMKMGGAAVSEKHANFIVNAGGAQAADVLALVELVQERVRKETGIHLKLEVHVVDTMGRIGGHE